MKCLLKTFVLRLLKSYSLEFSKARAACMYTHARSFKVYVLNLTANICLARDIRCIRRTRSFLEWKLSCPSSLFLFPYGTKSDGPFLFPPRLAEGYGIVCLTLSSLEDRGIRRTKRNPSRKTRQHTRRSTGLSILFPEFPFGSLPETLTARRKPIH